LKCKQRQKLNKKQTIILFVISLLFLIMVPTIVFSTHNSNPNDSKKETKVKVPKQYKLALRSAENHSLVLNLSKQSLTEMLSADKDPKLSDAAINYALKHAKIDYNYNALQKAKEYSDSQNMSRQGIYDQLISQAKFTEKQAQYAVDNLMVDYNQNALQSAKNYKIDLGFSPAKIREVLISDKNEKFTPEQADYAIQHLND